MDERGVGDALWSPSPRRAEAAPKREQRAEKEARERERGRERERRRSCGVKGVLAFLVAEGALGISPWLCDNWWGGAQQ
jgi:hypothetical protein